MNEREYKYIDAEKIHESDMPEVREDPITVLYESLLDILQLAEAEGMYEEEVDTVLRRVMDFREERKRRRYTLGNGPT